MDFSFFEQLSKNEAELFLERFLSEGMEGFNKLLPAFEKEQITIDFSIESIPPVINWVYCNIITIPEQKDESLPFWIKESDSYLKGLYSFNEVSKVLIFRASYYFGECYIRNSKKLSWNIGNKKAAVCNMPVVTGFRYKMELAPMLIVENLISRLVEGTELLTIKNSADYWLKII